MRLPLTNASGAALVSGAAALALLCPVVAGWEPLLAVDRAAAVALHHRALTGPGPTGVARVFTDWVWDP
jgi:hypothetical protein